ncbi:MAG TPA: histidinol-phosphate transaminase, partial [Casimicrobiaceae bacterium]|nr:histidinol-phosphate transaminase [Casimicrobiaceae bacterium]
LKQALRSALDLPEDLGILLGNGSDEIIQMLTALVAGADSCVVAPEPSFVMYRLDAQFARVRYVGVPLRADFSLDEDAMLAAIATHRPALVWIAYPNNPTGNLFDGAAVARIIAAAPGIVAIDEAYYAFANQSFLARVLDYPNLIVVRTLSKIGMAGLRLGYAVAHPAWTNEIDKLRPPYNVNALTQAIAPVLLAEGEVLRAQADAILRERARLAEALGELRRVEVFPTQTNFVLVRVPDANAWFAALRAAGILVKNLHAWHPLLENCLRITVGTPDENNALLKALERYA